MSWKHMPSWYPEMKAARYLGIDVDELRRRPMELMERAFMAATIDEDHQTYQLAKIMGLLK